MNWASPWSQVLLAVRCQLQRSRAGGHGQGWYENGTEIIFACGGSMFSSIVSAASANDMFVVGVDVDSRDRCDLCSSRLSNATSWAIGNAGEWEKRGPQPRIILPTNLVAGKLYHRREALASVGRDRQPFWRLSLTYALRIIEGTEAYALVSHL